MSPLPEPLVGGDPIAAVPQWTLDLRLGLIGGPDGLLYDTGWQMCTPRTGWAHDPAVGWAPGLQVRRIGHDIRFRGRLTGSLTVNTTTAVADVPAGFLPPLNGNIRAIATTAAFIGYAQVTPAGIVSVHFKTPLATGTHALEFSGLGYLND